MCVPLKLPKSVPQKALSQLLPYAHPSNHECLKVSGGIRHVELAVDPVSLKVRPPYTSVMNTRQTCPHVHAFQHHFIRSHGCCYTYTTNATRTQQQPHTQDPVPFMQGGVLSRCSSGASAFTAAAPQPRPAQLVFPNTSHKCLIRGLGKFEAI